MRHYVEGRAFTWHCGECGNEQREDEEPYYENCLGGGCRYVRYSCNNIDCKVGPMARWLMEALRRDRCPCCKGAGLIEIDGDEAPCPVEGCLASELLIRDYVAERIFSPSFHRDELGITHTVPGRIDPPMDGPGRVVNKHHRAPDGTEAQAGPNTVYIGRGSLFGNPFTHRKGTLAPVIVGSREEAIEAYRLWLTTDLEVPGWQKPTREQVISLRGKTLACWCSPKACHGDVLLELAELWSSDPSA